MPKPIVNYLEVSGENGMENINEFLRMDIYYNLSRC